jgi:hypothetical protein
MITALKCGDNENFKFFKLTHDLTFQAMDIASALGYDWFAKVQ